MLNIHPSALKHGVGAEDIEHAVVNAMVIEDLEDDMRLYLGPRRDARCSRSCRCCGPTAPSS